MLANVSDPVPLRPGTVSRLLRGEGQVAPGGFSVGLSGLGGCGTVPSLRGRRSGADAFGPEQVQEAIRWRKLFGVGLWSGRRYPVSGWRPPRLGGRSFGRSPTGGRQARTRRTEGIWYDHASQVGALTSAYPGPASCLYWMRKRRFRHGGPMELGHDEWARDQGGHA